MAVIVPKNLESSVNEALLQSFLGRWSPASDLSVLKELVGGKTGASVLLVDIRPSVSGNPSGKLVKTLSGQFVLKIDQKKPWNDVEPTEAKRHSDAVNWNPSFAKAHIPKLLFEAEDGNCIALLYEIAGLSRLKLITVDGLDAASLNRRCRQLAGALLSELNATYSIETNVSAAMSLTDWLGYRLDPKSAPALHDFIEKQTKGAKAFVIGGKVLINPLWFCCAPQLTNDNSHSRFVGLLHGDLHADNFLLDRHYPSSELFWLIDFALSRVGPLFYDHAYLELAMLLRSLAGKGPELLFTLLSCLDASQQSEDAKRMPPEYLGLVDCLSAMRKASDDWQLRAEEHRRDSYLLQNLLARTAVSLNWANKPLEPNERRLALAYGAWSCTEYLRMVHESEWAAALKEGDTQTAQTFPESARSAKSKEDTEPWESVWQELGQFDESLAKFILVTGPLNGSSDCACLGFLPWASIVDLDPASDETGFYSIAGPILEQIRSVTYFGKETRTVNFNRGTAWMMAGGWPSRAEHVPHHLDEWRRNYLRPIRELSAAVRQASAPQIVNVVIFPTGDLTGGKLQRLLEAMDEEFRENARFYLFDSAKAGEAQSFKTTKSFLLSLDEFISGVRRMYGSTNAIKSPEIPGIHGPTVIPLARLRNLEEDLKVLHSNVLSDSSKIPEERDAFWRGNPPSWADLYAEVDIIRNIHEELVAAITTKLHANRNTSVELHHSPGSGGTTAALRAAWTVRNVWPTAVLRNYSRLTADRVDELFHLAGQPVLLVAEASELPPAARNDLFRELISRNSRVVILYVIRTSQKEKGDFFTLYDPMQPKELQKFYKAFSVRTEDDERIQRLKQISNALDHRLIAYRSPFFFGLTTYEQEFVSIERYVTTHLNQLSDELAPAVRYLSLVSRYSQSGLSESLFKKLIGFPVEKNLKLETVLGSGAARLVLRTGGQLKIIHPLIAEEILRQMLNSGARQYWSSGLKDLAISLIKDVVVFSGGHTEDVRDLFFQLFILRDEWSEEFAPRKQFSALIEAIDSEAGQFQVLELLTTVAPKEAHYWNHLGRHIIYRTNQGFETAEAHLLKAVELSSGSDSLHFHALGLVLRFWIRSELTKLFAAREPPTPEKCLDAVEELANRAFEAFTKGRELNTEDPYGYITHIQTILFIAESIRRASRKNTIRELLADKDRAGEWVRKNMWVAEDLLGRVQHFRGHSSQSVQEKNCIADLGRLYGDFDGTIDFLEAALKSSGSQSHLRNALASIYLAKRDRLWSSLAAEELRRIVELMERNLADDPVNARSLRMWFLAYRRLPEFNYNEAIHRLLAWASRGDSVDAHYYLYILHFLRWRSGGERDEELIMKHLNKCKQLATGRRRYAYEWLCTGPEWCPLVNDRDLGKWDEQKNFFVDTKPLALVDGTIATIKRQAGTIRLGEVIKAFFVPPKHIRESKDINADVHFFLGFSYEGFHAWEVDLGRGPNYGKIQHSTARLSGRTSEADRSPGRLSNPVVSEKVDTRANDNKELYDQVKNYVIGCITEGRRNGSTLSIATLGNWLRNRFPGTAVHKRLGYFTLTKLLNDYGEFELIGTGPETTIRQREPSNQKPGN